jgi:hypothetical protein
LDGFGRFVLHLSRQLAALASCGVWFISTTQGLDTDSRKLAKPVAWEAAPEWFVIAIRWSVSERLASLSARSRSR